MENLTVAFGIFFFIILNQNCYMYQPIKYFKASVSEVSRRKQCIQIRIISLMFHKKTCQDGASKTTEGPGLVIKQGASMHKGLKKGQVLEPIYGGEVEMVTWQGLPPQVKVSQRGVTLPGGSQRNTLPHPLFLFSCFRSPLPNPA